MGYFGSFLMFCVLVLRIFLGNCFGFFVLLLLEVGYGIYMVYESYVYDFFLFFRFLSILVWDGGEFFFFF